MSDVKDALATQRIKNLVKKGPYISWSESALSATAISTVLNDIQINHRSVVVECGGGVSSIYVASLIKEIGNNGSHLYTIEHDEEWIEILHEMMENHNVLDWVTIIHAPLSQNSLSWNGEKWYDLSVLEAELQGQQIDLLVVDGPPAHRSEIAYSRYPAIPFFKDLFGERYCIVLDDIDREAERKIVEEWERELRIDFQRRLLNGNIAIGTKGQAFTI